MRRHLHVVCGLAFLVILASPAAAQLPDGPRFAASGAIGVSRPLDRAMSDVYGSRMMAVAGQFDVQIAPAVWAFAGVKRVGSDGRTVIVGTPIADEQYATSLRMTSYRLGVLVSRAVASKWSLAGGGGVCITSYEETWPDASLAVSDRSIGFVLAGEGRYHVTARWGAILRVEYATAPATISVVNTDVNLGGLDVLGGLRFSF